MSSSEDSRSNLRYRVGVIGLGFVGSAVAAVWLRSNAMVFGFDISESKVGSIKGKTMNVEEGVRIALQDGIDSGNLFASCDNMEPIRNCEIKIVCVPVYLSKDNTADLSLLEKACKHVALYLKKGDAIIICPSVPPGTTRQFIKPILELGSSLVAGEDFDLIYSPERIFVGRAVEDIERNYPAIISGINEISLDRASHIFSLIAKKGVVKMPDLETAEFEKLAEGAFRDTNIALANQLALICEESGIDFWAAREAANTQPYCDIHTPSFGVGGACIPVYPWFLIQSSGYSVSSLIRQSRMINDSMIDWLINALRTRFSATTDTRIAILGLAFRGDVADSRMSLTYRLVSGLKSIGLNNIVVHDPLIHNDAIIGPILVQDLDQALYEAHIALLVTDHSAYKNYDWNAFRKSKQDKLIMIDGKGILRGKSFPMLEIYGLGYGLHHKRLV